MPHHPARRRLAAVAVLASGALVLAGCSGGSGSTSIDKTAPKTLSGTVSLWHFFSDREARVVQSVVDDFEKANPKVHVEVHAGQDDEKLQKVIAAGGNIDVGLSYSTDIVGTFCQSGAFRDLTPYIERDDVDLSDFQKAARDYTAYDGIRCSVPVLADTNALYYDPAALEAAGISGPPKTLDELSDDTMKLTTYNADGSIKTLGFDPLMGFYENSAAHLGPSVGATWLKSSGKSAIGDADNTWPEVMKWQKSLVDAIGYDKLQAFTAGLGQEFSAENAFQKGKVAMEIDGEYRTAFLEDQAPDLTYATAPFPTASDHTDLYGAGYISGNIAGIAKGSKHPELAWALLKYLSTDTDAVVKLANGLKNIPTLNSALTSSKLEVSDQYRTFIDVAKSSKTTTTPASPLGGGYAAQFEDYWGKYQQGKGGSLTTGLEKVDKQIDDALALSTGP